jgi:hypothetical protein
VDDWNNAVGGVVTYPRAGSANHGKIVVVGRASNGTKDNFLVARYLPSEPEIGPFTANPNPVTGASCTTLTASNITDGNPSSTITPVAFYVQVNGTKSMTAGSQRWRTRWRQARRSATGPVVCQPAVAATPGRPVMPSQEMG